jgi:glucokinase
MNCPIMTYHALADIGGTKVSVSLVRSDGVPFNQTSVLSAQQVEPTTTTGDSNAIPRQIIRMLGGACASLGVTLQQIESVNVATCGLFLNGELVAPNLCGGLSGELAHGRHNDWTSIPLLPVLQTAFHHDDCPIRIENDGIAALMAELRWGALQGTNHAAYVTWSTGIGVGLYVDGRVLRGKNGNAGHAGHMVVGDAIQAEVHHEVQPLLYCACGNVGDAQSQIAGSYIPKRWPAYPSSQALLDAARRGDAIAAMHVETLCEGMARVLYNLTTTLDLERIAIGGSVFWHHQDWLLPRVQVLVAKRFKAMTNGLSIVPAGLGASVGDYAALAILACAKEKP